MTRMAWALGGSLALSALTMTARGGDVPAPVAIGSGRISGVVVGAKRDVVAFRGIPFAAPPVGARRWKPPQPVQPWEGVRACDRFGPACLQPSLPGFSTTRRMSEDCLYLNVWAPAERGDGPGRPVMVWIHGGGFFLGSGSEDYYDGAALARRGVVVVTFNYRLGPFGFLAHPLLSRESERGVSGNYGLLDQIAALRWVRANIAAFGGDPDRVTIFGESAGARSVCALLVSPLAKGLFHRAIIESDAGYPPLPKLREPRRESAPAEAVGEEIAHELGCDTADDPLAALRAKSAAEVLAVARPTLGNPSDRRQGHRFGPIIDGWVLPDDLASRLYAGQFEHVPLIIGTNADEQTIFLRFFGVGDVKGYRALAGRLFPGHGEDALRMFPAKTDDDVPVALNRAATIAMFVGPARRVARTAEAAGAPVYLYHFTRVPSTGLTRGLGAFHSLELPYVFGTLFEHPGIYRLLVGPRGFQEVDRALSDAMMGYWTRFAATGNPNGDGLPSWPEYTRSTDRHLEFGDAIRAGEGLARAACDLFDAAWPPAR